MLSKGSVAILPLVLLIIVWWQRGRITSCDLLRTAPFFAVAVDTDPREHLVPDTAREAIRSEATSPERLAGAGAVVWFYLSKAGADRLIFVYPQWRIQTAR